MLPGDRDAVEQTRRSRARSAASGREITIEFPTRPAKNTQARQRGAAAALEDPVLAIDVSWNERLCIVAEMTPRVRIAGT